jgi:hypothetical protein
MAGTGIVRNAQGSATARPFVSRALSTEQRRGRRNKDVFERGARRRRLSPLTVAQSDRYLGACASERPMRCRPCTESQEGEFEQAPTKRRQGLYQPAATRPAIISGYAQKASAFGFPQTETRAPAPSHHQDTETLCQTPDVAISSVLSHSHLDGHVPDVFRRILCNRFREMPPSHARLEPCYGSRSDITVRRTCLAIYPAPCQDELDRKVSEVY